MKMGEMASQVYQYNGITSYGRALRLIAWGKEGRQGPHHRMTKEFDTVGFGGGCFETETHSDATG